MAITFDHTGSNIDEKDKAISETISKKECTIVFHHKKLSAMAILCMAPQTQIPQKKMTQYSLAEISHIHTMTWKVIKHHQRQ